jgi:hypothetical protein
MFLQNFGNDLRDNTASHPKIFLPLIDVSQGIIQLFTLFAPLYCSHMSTSVIQNSATFLKGNHNSVRHMLPTQGTEILGRLSHVSVAAESIPDCCLNHSRCSYYYYYYYYYCCCSCYYCYYYYYYY